jgi:hypothetical protein
VVIPPQPINWNLFAPAFNFGNVTDHSLLVGCAERADVLVDFSNFAGRTLILYNDAPTAFPALDPRYDYYTGDPDQTTSGGAPTTQPGFGPNTRTIMQVRIKGPTGGAALAGITVTSGGADYLTVPVVNIDNGGGTGATASATGSIDHVQVLNGGSGYVTAPSVGFAGGGGTGAAATATISRGRVTKITVTSSGSGYTAAPTITLSGGTPTVAATAISALYVSAITLLTPGSGYTSLPEVTLTGGGGYGATAVASFVVSGTPFDLAQLMAVWKHDGAKPGVFEKYQDPIIMPQAAYNSAYGAAFPADNSVFVQLNDFTKSVYGGPNLPNGQLFRLNITNGGTGYTNPVSVSITGGGGTGATATATQTSGVITSVFLTNGGTGYSSAPTITVTGGTGTGAVIVANEFIIEPKAMHDEMGAAYDLEYGRMGGLIGLELPVSTNINQALVLYPYISPPVDIVSNSMTPLGTLTDGTQIWKITHNGVDTHPIHFHLANVQLLNRVAWDGAMLPPEPIEIGWKETVRVNPLEHCIVAMRPIAPLLPFDVPNSVRAIDVTKPLGVTLMGPPGGYLDPLSNPTTVINHLVNFGWEYVWHCHILSHEEMDMMHALSFAMAPKTPTNLKGSALSNPFRIQLTWTNAAANATSFIIQRADNAGFTTNLFTWSTVGVVTSSIDPNPVVAGGIYYYRVQAINVVGDTVVYPAAVGYPHVTAPSDYSNVVIAGLPAVPTNLTGASVPTGIRLTWTDNAVNETAFTVRRRPVTAANVATGPYVVISTTVPAFPGTGTTSWIDTTAVVGQRYMYGVNAINAFGNSNYSNSVNVTR